MAAPRSIASPTLSRRPSSSPAPWTAAIMGVTTEGKKESTQKAEENIWFAAPCPASASGLPMRPTKSVSVAPTSGAMAKLSTAGRASARIRRSRGS